MAAVVGEESRATGFADAVGLGSVGTAVAEAGYRRQRERLGLVWDRNAAADQPRLLLSDMDRSRPYPAPSVTAKYLNWTLGTDATLVLPARSSYSVACATLACCFVSLRRSDQG